MKQLLNMLGVITAMNTPFTEDDKIDLDGLQRHMDYAIRSGIAAALIPVVASEVNTLTQAERASIMAAVMEVTDHRVPIIGGASATSKQACLEYVRQLNEAGCDGVLANIPYENDEQYTDYVHSIAQLHPGFLMVQDYDLKGDGVPEQLLVRLYNEVDCFRCLKIETNLPGGKYTRMLEATNGTLHISGGWSVTQYIEALDRGVHGMVPTGMHELYCKVDSLYRAGSRDKAVRLYEQMQPIIAFSNQHPTIAVYFYKRLLWKQGYYQTPRVRTTGVDFDRYYQRIADEMIEKFFALSEAVRRGQFD